MSKIISILTPTRQRVNRLSEFVMSVYQHTEEKNRVEMLMYVDRDDPTKEQYLDFMLHCKSEFPDFLKVHIVFDEPKSVSKSWNDLYARSTGDIIIMGNDDLLYRTPSWDKTVEVESNIFKDDIYCMWMDDRINSENHCAFPIVSKKWCETLGYFTPGVFHFGYNDTWVFDIAQRVHRCRFLGKVVAEHMHFSQNKSHFDWTYERNRLSDHNHYQMDKEIFDSKEMIQKRIEAAEKLKKVMQ